MVPHTQIIQLTVAYTMAGAFVFTVVVTCLSMVGLIKFAHPSQQRKLFYTLILELVALCIGFFAGLLKFDPQAVAAKIQRDAELKGDVASTIGLVDYSARANDFLPKLGGLINTAKKEVFLTGVSFYITVPEHKDLLRTKVQQGVDVKFLVFNHIDGDLEDVAAGFSQSPEELRIECETTLLNLRNLRDSLANHPNARRFEVRLFTETPRARFYFIDRGSSDGLMYFISHVDGINSPNLPGLLFKYVEGGFASLYEPSVQRLWDRSESLDSWLAKHGDTLPR